MAQRDETSVGKIGAVLGGRRVLGRTPKTSLELVGSIRSGLPYAAFEALAKQAELSTEEAESALLIPRRTLARRKTAGTLDAGSSERVVRLARIAARALDVFEDDEAAVTRWLRTPLRELAGETPLSLVDTDLGAQEALDVLERIEDGIFG